MAYTQHYTYGHRIAISYRLLCRSKAVAYV